MEVIVVVSFVGVPAPPSLRTGNDGSAPRQCLWQGVADPADHLVLLRFPNEDAARDDLRRLVENEAAPPPEQNLPSEVHHIEIEHKNGVVLEDVPVGGFLVVARAVASPGYGHEAGERLDEALSTFVQLAGYCGHLQGFNESVEEESWAFVFSTSRLNVPLPDNPEVAARLYRRIG